MSFHVVIRFFLLLFVLASSAAHADNDWKENIPDDLVKWLPWVLKDNEVKECPFAYNNFNTKYCQWPTNLSLRIEKQGGGFEQSVTVHDKAWVRLPGGIKHWPQEVKVNNAPVSIVHKKNLPYIHLEKGSYKISGRFIWDAVPAMLQLSPDVGTLSVALHGNAVSFPNIDGQGRFWIKQQETKHVTDADHLTVKIFRKMSDDIPFMVTTRFMLNVSGKNRDITLPGALLPGFTVQNVISKLQNRVEEDGNLRIKLRPGVWTVDVVGYQSNPIKELMLPFYKKPMPREEIWVFETKTSLRVVDVMGVQAIDPRQTDLPKQWHHFPSYHVPAEKGMRFEEKQRGDAGVQPDTLNIQRKLWLDFDGDGYTAKDHITGSVNKSSRLEVQNNTILGRAVIRGKDQFITKIDGGAAGIEVRRGTIDLRSDSRIEKAEGGMNAVSWAHDFKTVSSQLFLPPGWRLFAASGVDKASPSWISAWTLFDIFLILFVTMAMVKLMGIRIAIAGLITLIIVHIELPALSWSALFILAMIALEGVLPQSWFRKLVMFFKRAALLGVVLLVLPFMLMHMRDAIHPQLKGFSYGYTDSISSYSGRGSSHNRKNNYVAEQAMEMDGMAMPPPPPMIVPGVKTAGKIANRAIQKSQRFQGFYQYDPGAIVQTGFGVANWRGDTIALSWNGPVNHNQDVGLWLMSPSINLVLAFIRVLLLLMFVGFLLQVKFASFSSLLAKLRAKNTVALLLLGVLFIGLPQQSLAENGDIPPAQLLKELKHYALKERDKAPECLPQCATIARAHIQANGGRLSLRMEVHMSETAAIPLPGMKDHWPIEAVLVDGKAASGLLSQGKYTWLELAEGKHDVLVTGRLPDRDSLSINFKLKPHYVDFDVKGWELYGVHEDGIAEGNIQLVRIKAKQEKEATDDLEQTAIPPFVKVERTLSLGTSWTMVTRIHRQVPSDFAFVLTIPLINGESVTTPGVRVKNKAVEVNMAPYTSSFVWESVLKKSPRITLKADTNSAWVESWKLQATNLWHVEMAGIPKIHTGQAFPEWRPWPGEKVVLNITKPEGVAGQTKTIDKVKLKVNVGQRALDASAEFNIRSSRGDQHSVTLPEGAVLQSLVLNQRAQPLQQNGRQVTFPLSPGNQTINLSWKQPEGISSHFTMPELNLGIPSVNVETILTLPRDRWVLFTGGGLVGPAVLFWGVFPVLVLLSVALGFVNITPLKSYHWLLLLIGLSQTNIAVNVVVIGWFLAMGWRHKSAMSNSYGWFDTRQVVLGLWTVAAVISIFVAIQQGLLGSPNMKITGNGSHTYYLKWYQDISDVILPRPWAFSVPVLLYRGLMLLWALWLAFAFTGWLKWSWACFSEGDLWRKRPNKVKKEEPADKKAQESEGE